MKVVGIDGEKDAYKAIKAGKMVATFTYHFVAPEGVQYGYKVAKGEKFDAKEIILEATRSTDPTSTRGSARVLSASCGQVDAGFPH